MEVVYFTLAAIVIYLFSDWLLNRVETAVGKRFKQRSLIFFAIMITLSLTSFTAIRYLSGSL